ncbi:fungal-specific transcription factor domain-containing protein [Xylariales sp. PMI_506]|nr:fungal-specific transcription factor domain-containing protein [Xylariales sp. PMI_506]
MNKLMQVPWIRRTSPEIIHLLPSSVRHNLTCAALGYRIHKLPEGASSGPGVSKAWSKLYHHRGESLRALSEEVAGEITCNADGTIVGILTLLQIELRHFPTGDWRIHAKGAKKLIDLRGGVGTLFTVPHMKVILLSFTILGVMSNTTCPASDQIDAAFHYENIEMLSEIYGDGRYPGFLCPPPLFLDIIRVNYIRQQAATPGTYHSGLRRLAWDTLSSIQSFLPDDWVESIGTPYQEALMLQAHICQSSIALYCVRSLHGLLHHTRPRFPFSSSPGDDVDDDNDDDDDDDNDNYDDSAPPPAAAAAIDFPSIKRHHHDRLFRLLPQAQTLAPEQLGMSSLWPLVVAGADATPAESGTPGERALVARRLQELAREMGTCLPLLGRSVLERFWSYGKTGWDDCFNGHYAFVT